MIQPETADNVAEFLMANDEQQRHLFDEPNVSSILKQLIPKCGLEQEKSSSSHPRIFRHHQ